MYRLHAAGVVRISDGMQITRRHPDWPAYLAWLSAGGVPTPAEVAPPVPPDADPVPLYVSTFQARAVLLEEGLLQAVTAAIATADPVAQLAWDRVTVFRRDSPTIALVAQALGLTAAQLDDFFRRAAKISV